MPFNFSRRQFLKPVGIFVAGAAITRSLPLISNLLGDPVEAQTTDAITSSATTTIHVRQDIANWSQNQIKALKKGIRVMKSRPGNDPTSWIYQANMHGTSDSRNLLAWMTCQHGTDFFFPWHRMYLYYFERILRKASGSSSLALPYWNYSDSTAGLVLPAPFRSPADSSNPLYVSQRDANINNGQPLPAQDVSYSNAFSYTNFECPASSGASFGGQQVSVPTRIIRCNN